MLHVVAAVIIYTRVVTRLGSHKRRANAAIETELKIDIDPSWHVSNEAYHSTRQQIHNIWQPETRALDEGQFVRGKKDQPAVTTTIDPRASGSNWLSFGGGQQSRNSGVVDAFTGA